MGKIQDRYDPNWEIDRERIILFADIMGFKSMIEKNKHSDLVKKFKEFSNLFTKLIEPLKTGKHMRITIFSDSIIVGTDSYSLQNFNLIVKAATILMYCCYKFSWVLNGCIACGKLTFEEMIITPDDLKNKRKVLLNMPIFLGDSVIKAHLLNEDLFCYGIILHPTAEEILKESLLSNKPNYQHPFYFLPIPLKSGGNARLYYLSWNKVKIPTNLGIISSDDIQQQLYEIEKNSNPRARSYINNTLKVISELIELAILKEK